MGQFSVRNGMDIDRTNENLKRMVELMRAGDYENAYAILRDDHFTTGMDCSFRNIFKEMRLAAVVQALLSHSIY